MCEKQMKKMSKAHRKQDDATLELAASWKSLCATLKEQTVATRQAFIGACTSIEDKSARIEKREAQPAQMFVNPQDPTAGMSFLCAQKPELLGSVEILRAGKDCISVQGADAQLVQPFDSLAQETLQLQVDKRQAHRQQRAVET
jgi:hypothetical protein